MNKPLLPSGCYDVLPPHARQEREILARLLAIFDAHGYEQVAPPLMEYTDTLLAGRGAALSAQVLRVIDPATHKVMGLRADHTLQIGRIAATRLAGAALPLRLCYAGSVCRARGEKQYGSRQLKQAGIELIGIRSPEADAEAIIVGARALKATGLDGLTVDLNSPGIVRQLLAGEVLAEDALAGIMNAVAHKDVSALAEYPLACGKHLQALAATTGEAAEVLPRLRSLGLPQRITDHVGALETVVQRLRAALPEIRVTLDPAETRGLEYHSGITFSFFAAGSELGRGGRYRIERAATTLEATGCTLYVNMLRRALPEPAPQPRAFAADPSDLKGIEKLQKEGFAAVPALPEYDATPDEARRLGCTHFYDGKLKKL